MRTIRKFLSHRSFLCGITRNVIFRDFPTTPLSILPGRGIIDRQNILYSSTSASLATTTTATKPFTTMSNDDNHQQLQLFEVEKICKDALLASGIHPVAAAAITDVVTCAERDGCHSHGLFRVPGYCQGVLSGMVDGAVEPQVHDASPGVVRVDAGGGYSPPAILAGKDLALQKAKENGIACLAIHNSAHFAALWWEVEKLANEGMVVLAVVNSRSFVAHRPGGTKKLYGTNPMAFGFPRAATAASSDENDNSNDGENHKNIVRGPLVWDQASAAMARGEISLCQREGHALPEGVAIDREGQPTTCPEAALEGAQLPFGGHKGSMIAMMVELLAAGLTGSQFSFEADQTPTAKEHPHNPTLHGELLILIDPTVTSGGNGYLQHCELLFDQILQQEGTRLPSTRRYANRLVTPTKGVTIPKALYEEILALANSSS